MLAQSLLNIWIQIPWRDWPPCVRHFLVAFAYYLLFLWCFSTIPWVPAVNYTAIPSSIPVKVTGLAKYYCRPSAPLRLQWLNGGHDSAALLSCTSVARMPPPHCWRPLLFISSKLAILLLASFLNIN